MTTSISEEEMAADDNGLHIVIDDTDNNGYIPNDEVESDSTHMFDQSTMYSIIGKIFDNSEVAYTFYNEFALSKGFGIRKFHVSRHKVTNEIYRRIFVCNKQGFKDMNDKRRSDDAIRRSITRTGCKAMIQVTLSKQEEWVVDKFIDEHNHTLDPPNHVVKQRSHSIFHRSNECKDVVKLLSTAGMKPSEITKIVRAFRGENEDKLTRVQCSNIVVNERKRNLGKECHGIIMHFQEKVELEKDFYFAMDLSPDGTFRNVFWADGRSRSSYCQFGDVVFDTTYKTNRFSLPFAPFVGVNHHGQSILFGAALLENESEATFTWLFKQFLKCMHESPPISIITDQDLVMGKAIVTVFPKARHRFCAWHIQKHVLEHLQSLRSQYDDFKDTYNQWVKSQNVEDFESKWEELKEKYHISNDTWLGHMYTLRHHWIKTYLKDTFFAGMTTSGRCESIHSFFDGYVNSKTMLNDFVLQYDKAVNSRRAAEEDQDFRTSNSRPTLLSDHPIEAMAAKCYTRNMYEVFRKQWKDSVDCGHKTLKKDSSFIKYRVGFLEGNKENWKIVEYRLTSDFFATCSCGKFETYGIFCKHILYIMKKKQLKVIPDNFILPRWTMKAKYKVGNIRTGLRDINGAADATKEVNLLTLWSVRSKFNKVIDDGRDNLNEIKKLDVFLDGLLEDQNRRKKNRIESGANFSSTIPFTSQGESSQHILVSDPKNPVKTKGRPKVATRIKSGLEVNMDLKKRRTCGYCKEKGHYSTECVKRKAGITPKDVSTEEIECDPDAN